MWFGSTSAAAGGSVPSARNAKMNASLAHGKMSAAVARRARQRRAQTRARALSIRHRDEVSHRFKTASAELAFGVEAAARAVLALDKDSFRGVACVPINAARLGSARRGSWAPCAAARAAFLRGIHDRARDACHARFAPRVMPIRFALNAVTTGPSPPARMRRPVVGEIALSAHHSRNVRT